MNRLTESNELLVSRFSDQLSVVLGPDDMFPPDLSGDREPINPPGPSLPAAEKIALAAVYDLAGPQLRRRALGRTSLALINRMDVLIDSGARYGN